MEDKNIRSTTLKHSLNGFQADFKKHHRAKTVIDKKTGIKFMSAAEAAKYLGLSSTHMVNQLNGNVPNKTTLVYDCNNRQ